MSTTLYGDSNGNAGGGIETALAATTALQVIGPKTCKDREARRLFVHAVSDVVIRLNYLFSPDSGTTWVVGKQIAASTVTVDGGTAGYVKSCELDIPIGFVYKVEVYNTTGGAAKVVWEFREYTESA